MGHVLDGKRVASYLNSISEKQFQFTALKNPKCKLEDVLKTMEELKEVVFYRINGVPDEEVRNLSGMLLERCVQIMFERKVPPEKFQISTDQLNKYFLRALLELQDGEYRGALRSLMIYESYGEAIFSAYPHLNYYKGLALLRANLLAACLWKKMFTLEMLLHSLLFTGIACMMMNFIWHVPEGTYVQIHVSVITQRPCKEKFEK